MAFEVIHGDQRFARGKSQRLGGHQADHHAADQARPGGAGDGVHISQRDAGFRQYGLHHRRQPVGMGAGGEFGHHAAKAFVGFVLAGDALGQNGAITAHQGDRGFIAAGFDTENQWASHGAQLGPVLPIRNRRAMAGA